MWNIDCPGRMQDFYWRMLYPKEGKVKYLLSLFLFFMPGVVIAATTSGNQAVVLAFDDLDNSFRVTSSTSAVSAAPFTTATVPSIVSILVPSSATILLAGNPDIIQRIIVNTGLINNSVIELSFVTPVTSDSNRILSGGGNFTENFYTGDIYLKALTAPEEIRFTEYRK